jgi:hypothetical protein
MSDLPFATVVSLIGLTLGLASAANAACLDLKQTNVLSLEGTLSYRIFAGPPNYEPSRFVPVGMNLSIRATSSARFRFFPSPRTKPLRCCRETFDDGSESKLSWRGLHHLAHIPDITTLP